MKRILGLLVVLAAVLLIGGCAQTVSYVISSGDTVSGFCEQVSTNNSNIQNVLALAGYTQGSCAALGFTTTGHSCTFSAGSGTTSYDITEYWGTGIASGTIQSYCTAAGGTYK
jgi:hypothetical protein